MVLVEVREHDPPYVPRGPAECADHLGEGGAGAAETGVDQGQLVIITPEIGLADRETQQMQAGEQLHDVHDRTVEGPPPAGEGP